MAIFTTLRGEIRNSIYHKLQNSMEVDSVGIIAILSMSQITTLSVVKIAIKFSPYRFAYDQILYFQTLLSQKFLIVGTCVYWDF